MGAQVGNNGRRRSWARSLAHNILRGRGACWSSRMGLQRVDKLHSLTRACTQPTQNGQCIVGAPLVLGQATGNTDTQDSPWPKLAGSHHLPPYSILCSLRRSLHPNDYFSETPKFESQNFPGLESRNFGRPYLSTAESN